MKSGEEKSEEWRDTEREKKQKKRGKRGGRRRELEEGKRGCIAIAMHYFPGCALYF